MSNQSTQEPAMNWHKFLIYFALWASALLAVGSGARLFTGSNYGTKEVAERVYAYYEGLKSTDMVFGVLQLGLAGYLIFTRFQLAGLKKGAPDKLTIAYILNLLLGVGYLVAVSGVTKMPMGEIFDSSTSSGIASSIVMLIANRIYYQKRAFLFEEKQGTVSSGHQGARSDSSNMTTQGAHAESGSIGTQATQKVRTGTTAGEVGSRYTQGERFCTNCGKKADPEDRWCTSCGMKLD